MFSIKFLEYHFYGKISNYVILKNIRVYCMEWGRPCYVEKGNRTWMWIEIFLHNQRLPSESVPYCQEKLQENIRKKQQQRKDKK